MLDTFVASKGSPEVVQLSGGGPTIHPQILDFIALAQSCGIDLAAGLAGLGDRMFVIVAQDFQDAYTLTAPAPAAHHAPRLPRRERRRRASCWATASTRAGQS